VFLGTPKIVAANFRNRISMQPNEKSSHGVRVKGSTFIFLLWVGMPPSFFFGGVANSPF